VPAKDRADLRTGEWKRKREYVLQRDGRVCAMNCGREADTVDHIEPVSKGGTSDLGNLVAMCRTCNSRKGDRLMPPRQDWANSRWGVVVP
jgi:5-methylcytosine-specific restriction endonuclease McrA